MNIWWIRRDLRLTDNVALSSALAAGKGVVPVFILDEYLIHSKAEKRLSFLFDGLRRLREDLRNRGSDLIIRLGNPEIEIPTLAAAVNADQVFAEEDFSPYAIRRDAKIQRLLPLRLVQGLVIHPPASVTKPDHSPYTIFTPFSNAWRALPRPSSQLSSPKQLNSLPPLSHGSIPETPAVSSFLAGEAEAINRLNDFLEDALLNYAENRDRLDLDGTSTLSPYLHFGMLSSRMMFNAAIDKMSEAKDYYPLKSINAWINELIWREFYQSILYHFPYVLNESFNEKFRGFQWRESQSELHAWREGRTGYPVVDAAMRQLNVTGWMHNRARMIAASFLVKDLLINWQEGEHWFMQSLIDGDLAANNGGWQWIAGTGTDAAPYFRIFNPVLQGKKFDPSGVYIRKWIPELERVPLQYLHAPWEMPAEAQRLAGVNIGVDYPNPLIDHATAWKRALSSYQSMR